MQLVKLDLWFQRLESRKEENSHLGRKKEEVIPETAKRKQRAHWGPHESFETGNLQPPPIGM